MKPTPRAKFSYNARTHSAANKDMVSIASLINADIALKVLYEAHGQGLEKDDKAILASTLKTTTKITHKLEKLLAKHQRRPGEAGMPHIGAEMQHEASKCASCSKKLSMLARGGNCVCCGYISCSKCISLRQVPRCFGFDESSHVKVCALCSSWFHDFLNSKFEEYSRPKEEDKCGDSSTLSDFRAQLDVATEEGYLPKTIKKEIEAALESPLTVSTASSIMGKLKHILASVVAHYEYQDDMDSNDSDNENPSRKSSTKLAKRSGVPASAIQSILSLMVLLDGIQPDEDEPIPLDDESLGDTVVETSPEHVETEFIEADAEEASREMIDHGIENGGSEFFVTLFRRSGDRYRLLVSQGVAHVTSIARGTEFSFHLSDVQLQSIVGDAVRLSFGYRSDLVYQYASESIKAEFCALVDKYKSAHPVPEKRKLPLATVIMGGGDSHIRGVLMATNYRVLFVPVEDAPMVEIPLFDIISVSRVGMGGTGFSRESSSGQKQAGLVVTCKDVRSLRVDVAEDQVDLLQSMISQLAEATQRHKPVHLMTLNDNSLDVPHFAFCYLMSNVAVDGWQFGHITRDYERMGCSRGSNDAPFQWVDNENGQICDTYPQSLVLPAHIRHGDIVSASLFRAKNRLPVVTWMHPKHKSLLVRSSQPLLGRLLSGTSCNMDEAIIEAYRTLPGREKPLYIFDARKSKAAAGNRLMGKGGVETSENYAGAIIYHLDISNMYKMQASFQALVKICLVPEHDKSWWSAVEGTRWFEHLQLILEGASRIARVLAIEGASALVHCSDGWDRTCQLVCLAQIMLDPYYRTLHGFATLVEKDWCLFGHKFMERLGGNRGKDPTRSKMSPIFLQFLDAVYQIMLQFPNAFEFNDKCLLHLANALSSGMYGTFVYDSYQQRKQASVHTKTVSVWTPLCSSSGYFLNVEYTPTTEPLWIWTGHQALKLWTAYFFQYHEYQCKLSTSQGGQANPQTPETTDD
ncbi:unnamed protein product [Aphanomyces euteiches]